MKLCSIVEIQSRCSWSSPVTDGQTVILRHKTANLYPGSVLRKRQSYDRGFGKSRITCMECIGPAKDWYDPPNHCPILVHPLAGFSTSQADLGKPKRLQALDKNFSTCR